MTRGVFGTGLPGWLFASVLTISTATFLLWGGPLWSAHAGDSHIWRIAGSYLVFVPLAMIALRAVRALSWTRLFTTVALGWAIKMVLTAAIYMAGSPGHRNTYDPAPAQLPKARDVDRRAKDSRATPRLGLTTAQELHHA